MIRAYENHWVPLRNPYLGGGFKYFLFSPLLGEGSRYRLHLIGTTWLPQNLQTVRNHTVAIHSPSWHRRARARRAAARNFLRRWTSKTRPRLTQRVTSSIRLLESHHSKPFLKLARTHMEWNANWNRWGATKGRKGKGKGREMKKDKGMKEQAKGNKGTDAMASFPSYDTMPASAQSQSSTSSSQPSELRTVMAALLEANPGLTLPPALLATDAGQSMSRSREEISSEQKRLNLRRKAITKLERLQGALAKKKEQISAYKEFIREKLKTELTKFEKEKSDLETAITTQQEFVDRVEAGLQDASTIDVDEEDDLGEDISLASMLGLDEPSAKMTALAKERDVATAAIAVYQAQIQQMQNAGLTLPPSMPSPIRIPADVRRNALSPQNPQAPKRSPAPAETAMKRLKKEDTQPGEEMPQDTMHQLDT